MRNYNHAQATAERPLQPFHQTPSPYQLLMNVSNNMKTPEDNCLSPGDRQRLYPTKEKENQGKSSTPSKTFLSPAKGDGTLSLAQKQMKDQIMQQIKKEIHKDMYVNLKRELTYLIDAKFKELKEQISH